MVRAGFGVRMKMPPPLFPPSGPNSRFSSNVANFPAGRKPQRDFFNEPPSTLPFVRRPLPPPPLMSQQPLLPPLKRRFFPPREAAGEFPVPPMRPRIAPGMGFGLKRNNVRGSFLGAKLAKGDSLNVGMKGSKFPRFSQAQKIDNKSGKNETKSGPKNKKKSKKKSKKKTYTLTKEKSMKKPWVNEALKVEIEKKFALLEEAKAKNEPPAWNAYLEQKKLVDEINQALRLEYLGNHPELEFPYYCEACDRGFPAMDKFSEHKSQHITCGKQGCTFTGHPKIVEKHFMMQHRTGLFNRIVKGNSPEEIKKWITERKKHYPTKEKIEQKQAQREEMEKRGERYAERRKSINQRNPNFKAGPHNRFNTNTGNQQPPFKSHTFGRRGTFTRNRSTGEGVEEQPKKKEPVFIDDDSVVRNLPPFRGTAYYLNLENNSEVNVALDDDDIFVMTDDSDNYSNITNDCDKIIENMDTETVAESTDVKNSNSSNSIDENTSVNGTSENIHCDPISNSVLSADQNIVKSTPRFNNSLALLQCYDSDGDSDQDDDTTNDISNSCNTKINEPRKNDINDESEPDECSSKGAQTSEEIKQVNSDKDEMNNENEKTCESKKRKRRDGKSEDDGDSDQDEDTINDNSNSCNTEATVASNINEQQKNDTDEESEPEECSSKGAQSSEEIKQVNSDKDGMKNENEKTCEGKKRKRRRRKDDKSEDDVEPSTEKQIPEQRMPQVFHPRKRYRPPTLLEKLLAPEIKHERNVILQCVRYVVENNYFNK